MVYIWHNGKVIMSHGQERNLIIACKFAQMLVFFNKVSMFCCNISEPVYI